VAFGKAGQGQVLPADCGKTAMPFGGVAPAGVRQVQPSAGLKIPQLFRKVHAGARLCAASAPANPWGARPLRLPLVATSMRAVETVEYPL